jgi:hypothetical protein
VLAYILIYGVIKLASNYEVLKLFNDEEIAELNRIYDECINERVKRLHNLFYLDYRSFPTSPNCPYKEKLSSHFNMKADRMYYLEYYEGSFTRRHSDADEQSQRTVITMIDKSDDLEGGDTIVYLPHFKNDEFEFDVNRYKRDNEKDDEQGSNIIPVVLNLSVGESVTYDANLLHEVALVTKGHRRVLVSWLL